MTSSWTVLLSCLLLASQGWADMDNNQQIEEMINNMMAAKMVKVQERMETQMRADMKEKDEQINKMKEKMEKGEMMRGEMREEMEEMREKLEKKMEETVEVTREEMEETDNTMKKQLNMLETLNAELTTKLNELDQKSLRDLPYMLACAYRDKWTTPSATITYDRLSADYNNSDRPGGGDGEMDISTGKFTALTAGHYTITFSGWASVDPGEEVVVQLMHNDQSLPGSEGWWLSYSKSTNSGVIDDQGSRTVVSVELCTALYSLVP